MSIQRCAAILAAIIDKLCKLIRLLSADNGDEVLAAARIFNAEGLDLHALADALGDRSEPATKPDRALLAQSYDRWFPRWPPRWPGRGPSRPPPLAATLS